MDGYSRDLLPSFSSCDKRPPEFAEITDDREEIELNLGLSLGGCFGVDRKEKELVLSPSILGLMTPVNEDSIAAPISVACHDALLRTCSLPMETEEEWRKRKELQTLRRMEAKRKRSEKQRSFRTVRDRGSTGLFCPNACTRFGLHSWAAAAARGPNESVAAGAALQGLPPPPPPPPSSQGSVGSQGSSSYGVSEFECNPVQGLSNCTEARSPASVQSLPEYGEQKPVTMAGTSTTDKSGKLTGVEMDNSSKKRKVTDNGAREMGKNVMEDMPCVSTKGNGPNGRRIEGFLYRYGKAEEVRIVCVCHGSFLSPAEFVKHAGGSDVLNPLRHIMVNPTSAFL